jgi:hypothetical protein
MKWYWLVLIIYVAWLYMQAIVFWAVSNDIKDKSFKKFVLGIIKFPISLIAYVFVGFITLLFHSGSERYTFTVHPLTRNNKILLRELGFNEGEFISEVNLEYEGFRYGRSADIIVCYNGRISYKRGLNKKCHVIIQQLRELPSNIEDYRNVANDKKRNDATMKTMKANINKEFGVPQPGIQQVQMDDDFDDE